MPEGEYVGVDSIDVSHLLIMCGCGMQTCVHIVPVQLCQFVHSNDVGIKPPSWQRANNFYFSMPMWTPAQPPEASVEYPPVKEVSIHVCYLGAKSSA